MGSLPGRVSAALQRCTTVLAWLVMLSALWGLSDVRPREPGQTLAHRGAAGAEDFGGASLSVEVVSRAPGLESGTATLRLYHARESRYAEVLRRELPLAAPAALDELPLGEAWLVVDAAGHARASRRVLLGPGQSRIRVTLDPAHGLVVTVRDEAGQPLGGATVLVNGDDPLPHGALVGVDGTARFARLGPPPWVVTAQAPGYETVTRQGVSGDFAVTLRSLGLLDVRVEQGDGAPAAGATVVIVGTRLWPPRRVTTDERGQARIAGLLAGSYDLRATRGSETTDPQYGLVLGPSARQTVTLRLRAGRFVTVLVTDGEAEGAPIVAGADVVVVEEGLGPFPERGRTDTSGKAVLGPFPRAPASASARAEGFVARSGVALEAEADEVRVALQRAARLEGEIVDGWGRPIEGASVEVIGTDQYGMPVADSPGAQAFQIAHFGWSLTGPLPLVPAGELGVMPGPVPPIPRGAADPLPLHQSGLGALPRAATGSWVSGVDGRFSATPVTPGRVRAFVRHPAYVEGISEPVTLAPGGTGKVRVVLEVGGNLEGRLVDERGFPVAGARIEVTAARGTAEVVTFSADDGTFAFAAIPAEVIVALARPEAPARTVLTRSLSVPPDRTTRVQLVLPPPRETVRVLVTDGEGQPVDGAQVTALGSDAEAPFRETRFTGIEGTAEFEDARGRSLSFVVDALRLTRAKVRVAEAPAELRITLEVGVIVTGHVTAVRGRLPVAGARIVLTRDGQRFAGVTDREGAYRLRDVPPGPARLEVSHPEHATVRLDVVVERTGRDDRPRELAAIDLVEPGTVEGVVRDKAGHPVTGARVALGIAPSFLPAGPLPAGLAVTDAQGGFRLDAVAPGSQQLEAYAADVGRGNAVASVTAGRATRGITIVLDRPAGEAEPPSTGNVAVTLGERGERPEVFVVHVAPESEAERSGLQEGDRITAIDGHGIDGMSDARARLAGRAGTDAVIAVERDEAIVKLRIAREPVRR